jgi:hypothetical protein
MAYSDTSIGIHLVKNLANEKLDDTVRIVKNLEDSAFELTFKDNGDPVIHKAYQMTRDNVCDYIHLLLKNLSMDEDGYQSIQFSLPAMPRMIVTASNLEDTYYRDHFLELVENSLTMLDKVEKLSIKKPVEKKQDSYPVCSRHNCDLHTSSGCCEIKMNTRNSFPELPKSPNHTYFE